VKDIRIVPDETEAIRKVLMEWADISGYIDVILTTGGTGFTSRDITPEATLSLVDRLAPGIVEAIRAENLKVTRHAMLSRAVAGIRGKTLILNLPGSPKGAVESFNIILAVLKHAVQLLRDDPGSENSH
jgi:molybdenum cofactor synthesis domain-containing protein